MYEEGNIQVVDNDEGKSDEEVEAEMDEEVSWSPKRILISIPVTHSKKLKK